MTPREQGQAAFDAATKLGQPLEAVTRDRRAQLEFQAVVHETSTGAGLTAQIYDRRRHGSRFISTEEWNELKRSKPSAVPPAILTQLELLRSPWRRGVPQGQRNIVLLDARPLQLSQENGTKRHALAVALAVARALPEGLELALLAHPDFLPLPDDILSCASIEWRPALLSRVKTFVQLATMFDPVDPIDIDILRAPWISRMSVFLDDIVGIYPGHFLGESYSFWNHQLGIEKLKSTRVVLALSETSQDEAKAIWGALPESVRRPAFLISSCVSGILPRVSPGKRLEESAHYVVFGNQLPHKNIALVAAALGVLRETEASKPHFTFVSSLSVAQESALRELATGWSPGSRNAPESISFVSHVSDETLDELVASARGVIVPSLHEGFSLPVVEAIERGIPVLLSRIPAHQELLPEGPWFFDPRDVASLVEAIELFRAEGSSWGPQQTQGLAHHYSVGTLDNRVRLALELCLDSSTEYPDLCPPRPDVAVEATIRLSPVLRATETVRETLVNRDAALMRSKMASQEALFRARLSSRESHAVLSREGHDALVATFHGSRSWRIGRIFVGPYHYVRRFLGGSVR